MWFAKPALRSFPLTIIAQDRSKQALSLGQRLLTALSQQEGLPPWRIVLMPSSIESALRRFPGFCREHRIHSKLWLITAANVINEVGEREKKQRFRGSEEGEESENVFLSSIEECVDGIASLVHEAVSHNGKREDFCQVHHPLVLFVEPGTRLGGKIIELIREKALQTGLFPTFPCPHTQSCPLTEGHGRRTWCHFTFDTEGAPSWLVALSSEAGLGKEALSLAPLMLSSQRRDGEKEEKSFLARIISAPFFVPALIGKARYACSHKGLLLLEDAEAFSQGSLLRLANDSLHSFEQDKKSGAIILRHRTAQKREEKRPEKEKGKQIGEKGVRRRENERQIRHEPG